MASLELLPAVDVTGGRVVQGHADPLAVALGWQAAGAEWIHLVDMDAAFGRGENRTLLAGIVAAVGVDVELSGGIVDDDSLRAALAAGCRRAVIGTSDLSWCTTAIERFGHRVAVALDVRGRRLTPRGTGLDRGDLFELLARLDAAGCARYILTDVDTDGALSGPNLTLLRDVCAATPRPVVASGGVAALADLDALRALVPFGVEGAIVGTALYDGRFTLEDALEVARADG